MAFGNLFVEKREVGSSAVMAGNPSAVEEALVRVVWAAVGVENLFVEKRGAEKETVLVSLEVGNLSAEREVLMGAV